MPSNTASSMYGGAGGRGSRASAASLEGLRSVLRNEPDRGSARAVTPTAPAPVPPAAPAAPADDKQTLRSLNDRLSGYLDRVRQLREENDSLEKQIQDILDKKIPEGRDWDETEEPLQRLKDKVNETAMENAKLLIQNDSSKLAQDDFKDKADKEKSAREELERDLEDLRKTAEDTRLNCEQKKKEIELVKEELVRLKVEHMEDVAVLKEKIRDSEVIVEIESKNSNLAEIVQAIRVNYDRIAQRNLKETEDWYQTKFENIQVAEAQNVETSQSGMTELKELQKERQNLEIRIQTLQLLVWNLEKTLVITEKENGQQLAPLNNTILKLSEELEKVKAQVKQQVETNKDLLCVKMKLKSEINHYQQLIQGMTADSNSLEFALEDAVPCEQQDEMKEEPLLKQERSPTDESVFQEEVEEEGEVIKPE